MIEEDDTRTPFLPEKQKEVVIQVRHNSKDPYLDKKSDIQIIPKENLTFQGVMCCACCAKDNDFITNREYQAFLELKDMTNIAYDELKSEHEKTLKEFYDEGKNIFDEIQRKEDSIWILYGFQGNNPTKDFRGGGYHSLEFMHYYIKNYSLESKAILTFTHFPFAITAINISFSIRQFLKLEDSNHQHTTIIGRKGLKKFLYNYTKRINSDSNLLFKLESFVMSCLLISLNKTGNNESIRLDNWIINQINKAINQLNIILNNDDVRIILQPERKNLSNK